MCTATETEAIAVLVLLTSWILSRLLIYKENKGHPIFFQLKITKRWAVSIDWLPALLGFVE